MKTIFPRILAACGSLALLAHPASSRADVWTVDVTQGPTNKNWTEAETWAGATSGFPNSSGDEVVYSSDASKRNVLLLDQDEIEIGALTATGVTNGQVRRIRAAEGQVASLKIGTLTKSGAGDLTIENGEGTLFVEIGTLIASTNIEVGRVNPTFGGYGGFEVTGSSTISGGSFAFDGGVASGEKRLKLGALSLDGTLIVTGRESNGGVVEVRSLTGTSGKVQVTNSTHNPNPTENPKTGTLEINATNFPLGESTTASYGGLIELGQVEQNSLAVVKKGEGIQIFSRATGNTYNGGTIIEGGVLAVSTNTNSGTSGLGTGEVEVRSGGTLAGNGRIRLDGEAVVVQSGGVIAPGAHLGTGVATLTLNGALQPSEAILSLESGAAFRFRLGADNASDRVAFTGYHANGFQISGTVTVDLLNASEGKYTLFSFNAIDAGELATLVGSLSLGEGLTGYHGTLGYDATSIFVEVQAIPEPSTTAFLLLGAGAAALSWWRQGRK
ncbi:MAG TPA: PEP-CTERM sorting domain-containing protein [Chthoniobacteraceae bacterium]|nr:PEP-CTERM sorting domain-containing protein [Chthoniobacteraceae bacterium]